MTSLERYSLGFASGGELVYKPEWLDQRSLKLDGLLSITLSNKNVHRLNKPRESHPDQIHWPRTIFSRECGPADKIPQRVTPVNLVRLDQIHPDQIYSDSTSYSKMYFAANAKLFIVFVF